MKTKNDDVLKALENHSWENQDDASKWAKDFMRTVDKHNITIDEDFMLGWFANAIEVAHDVRVSRQALEAQADSELSRKQIVDMARLLIARWDNGMACGSAMEEINAVFSQVKAQAVDIKHMGIDVGKHDETVVAVVRDGKQIKCLPDWLAKFVFENMENSTPPEKEQQTCKENAENLTGDIQHVKEKANSLHDALSDALMNAVRPNYDEDKGEWVLYCGEKYHAQALIDCAKETVAKNATVQEQDSTEGHDTLTIPMLLKKIEKLKQVETVDLGSVLSKELGEDFDCHYAGNVVQHIIDKYKGQTIKITD